MKQLSYDNNTRELSKSQQWCKPAAFKELLHVIKYVLDMKNLGLKLNPWGIPMNAGNVYVLVIATMQETQQVEEALADSSHMHKVYVSWPSKPRKSVSLSSSEVEYIALSELLSK